LNLSFTTGDQFSLERPPVYIIQKIGGHYRSPHVGFIPKHFLLQSCILMIDSRIRTYNPHPYLGLYDGFARPRHEPYLATNVLRFQLGNINQKEQKTCW